MKKLILYTLIVFGSTTLYSKNYINYISIHVAVDETLKEKKRTEKQRDKQNVVTGLDKVNEEENSKLNDKVNKIKKRLQSLGLLLDGVNMTIEMKPYVESIVDNLGKISKEIKDDPILLSQLTTVIKDVKREVEDTYKFSFAIMVSYGVVNQMKASDRKILLDHLKKHIKGIEVGTDSALSIIRNWKFAKLLLAEEWKMVKNREKDIMKEIIENAKKY